MALVVAALPKGEPAHTTAKPLSPNGLVLDEDLIRELDRGAALMRPGVHTVSVAGKTLNWRVEPAPPVTHTLTVFGQTFTWRIDRRRRRPPLTAMASIAGSIPAAQS